MNLGPTQENKREIKLGPVCKEIKEIKSWPKNQLGPTQLNNKKIKLKSK
jgi:hypothetical protein